MSKNKRAPKELAKYVLVIVEAEKGLAPKLRETFRYFATQKEAKAHAVGKKGVKRLYRIDYDFYGYV